MTNKTGLNGRKKVLIVLDTLRRGGIEIAALRFCRLLKNDDYECTFLVRKGENMDESMVGEIADIGAEIITKPSAADNYIKDYFFLLKTMKDGKYDIVHSHLLFYNGIVMRTAYKAGVRKRIAQSHATQDNRSRSRIKKFATDIYKRIMQRWDLSVLIVEHDMDLVMNISDYIYVLNYGKMLASGTPEEIQNNPAVIEAYLGGE